VSYGGEAGPDLAEVAHRTGLPPDEVIRRHAAVVYRVHAVGFAPGFPYLAGQDPCLQVPRRATPRTRVPSGSVAIASGQTGIYPRAGPGGWHLIGRTPMRPFMPGRERVFLIDAGDEVIFEPIAEERWGGLDKAAAAGEWVAQEVASG
jgi:KipI family sensor histidine kinase inhibitor